MKDSRKIILFATLILCLGLPLFAESQESKPETRDIVLKDGLTKRIRLGTTGNIAYEETRLNGKLHGTRIQYYDNGKIDSVVEFANGKRHGKWVEFYKDGTLILELTWKNGKRHGLHRGWYLNGRIKYETHYEKGHLLNGKYYKANGQVGSEIENGNGCACQYHSNGTLKRKTEYKNGLPDGETLKYHEDGHLYEKWTWSKGRMHGERTFFFEAGKFSCKGTMKDNRPFGKWVHYYENGNIKRVENYVDGQIVTVERYDEYGKKIDD